MPANETFEATAAAAFLQATLIWVALRYGGCFLYMQRSFQSMSRKDRRFLSTGAPQVDRYLVLSTVTIGSIATLIVSMLLNREISGWVAVPIFVSLTTIDLFCFHCVANQQGPQKRDILRDPFEDPESETI